MGLSDYIGGLEDAVKRFQSLRSVNRETRSAANILRQVSLRPNVALGRPAMVVKIDRPNMGEPEFILNPEHPDVQTASFSPACLQVWREMIKEYGSYITVDEAGDEGAKPVAAQTAPNQPPDSQTDVVNVCMRLYASLRNLIAVVVRVEATYPTDEVFTADFVQTLCGLPEFREVTEREALEYFTKLKAIRVYQRHKRGNVYVLRPERMQKRFAELPALNAVQGEVDLSRIYPDPQQYDAAIAHLSKVVVERVAIVLEESPVPVFPSVDDFVSEDPAIMTREPPGCTVEPLVVPTALRLSDDDLEEELRGLRERTELLQSVAGLRRQVKDATSAVKRASGAEKSAAAERDRLKALYEQTCVEYERCAHALSEEEQILADARALLADAERKVVV